MRMVRDGVSAGPSGYFQSRREINVEVSACLTREKRRGVQFLSLAPFHAPNPALKPTILYRASGVSLALRFDVGESKLVKGW